MAQTGAASLFTLPPGEFTRARDQLAAELRKGGRRDEAEQIKRLRRPTLAAWAVNQAVRGRPADVRALLDAGEQVRHAQRRALSGVRDAPLTEATRARRAWILQLAEAAAGKLAEQGIDPESHRDELAASFEAASADPAMAEQLVAAQLSKPLVPPSGFGDLSALTLVGGESAGAGEQQAGASARARKPAPQRAPAQRTKPARDTAAARKRADAAQKQARELGAQAAAEEASAREASRAAEEASRRAEEASRKAERLEQKAEDLDRRAHRLRAQAVEAQERARAAEEEAAGSGL